MHIPEHLPPSFLPYRVASGQIYIHRFDSLTTGSVRTLKQPWRGGQDAPLVASIASPPAFIAQWQVELSATGGENASHTLECPRGLSQADLPIVVVDPPATILLGGTLLVLLVLAVRLEDNLVPCRPVRIEHPKRVRKALRGDLRGEVPVRRFFVRVWEDVETEQARET